MLVDWGRTWGTTKKITRRDLAEGVCGERSHGSEGVRGVRLSLRVGSELDLYSVEGALRGAVS